MTQLHFSVDEKTAAQLQREAKRRGMTVSRYLASLVGRAQGREWPERYLANVVGSCRGSGLREPEDLPIDDVELG